MNTQPFSITRGQGKTQTIRVELDGDPLNLSTASAAQLTITPSALSPAVLLTKTLGAGVAAGAAGYATITLTAADPAAIDSIGSGVWSLLATINGTAVIVARGTVAITGPAQQFVDEGVDQTARDLAASATAAVLAHNADAAAHLNIVRRTLSGNLMLTAADQQHQHIIPDADRDVTLPAESAAQWYFLLCHAGAGYNLTIKRAGGTTVGVVIPSGVIACAWDGTGFGMC